MFPKTSPKLTSFNNLFKSPCDTLELTTPNFNNLSYKAVPSILGFFPFQIAGPKEVSQAVCKAFKSLFKRTPLAPANAIALKKLRA